jgi:hypothetical protein
MRCADELESLDIAGWATATCRIDRCAVIDFGEAGLRHCERDAGSRDSDLGSFRVYRAKWPAVVRGRVAAGGPGSRVRLVVSHGSASSGAYPFTRLRSD